MAEPLWSIGAGRPDALIDSVHIAPIQAALQQSRAFGEGAAARILGTVIVSVSRSNVLFSEAVSEGLAVARVASRVREGGHDIPTETVKRRFQLGIRNFAKLYRKLADDWFIIDGSKSSTAAGCRRT